MRRSSILDSDRTVGCQGFGVRKVLSEQAYSVYVEFSVS